MYSICNVFAWDKCNTMVRLREGIVDSILNLYASTSKFSKKNIKIATRRHIPKRKLIFVVVSGCVKMSKIPKNKQMQCFNWAWAGEVRTDVGAVWQILAKVD